jgi:hypothetical protein
MTLRKRWPNEADHARLDSISLARRIRQQIEPMLEALEAGKLVSSLELSLRLNRISNAAGDIEVKLIEAGPQEFLEEKDKDKTLPIKVSERNAR